MTVFLTDALLLIIAVALVLPQVRRNTLLGPKAEWEQQISHLADRVGVMIGNLERVVDGFQDEQRAHAQALEELTATIAAVRTEARATLRTSCDDCPMRGRGL